MKQLNGYRMKLVLAGCVAAIVFGGFELTKGATVAVGPGAGCDFDDIQAGIDAANDGDTVIVASGEYIITESITLRGKAVTVKSEAGPDETTIRMGTPTDTNHGSVVIFENDETTASVLDGFTITGGRGSSVLPINQLCGGGIFFNASSGTVRNCKIVQNSGDAGGGIFCAYACSPILIDCIIAENSAINAGGGGGPWSGASLNLTNCIIKGNSAKSAAYGTGVGGGAWCDENSSMTMSDCAIITNTARTGGGVFWEANASVTLTRCIVAGNTAVWGGGLGGWSPGSMTICNCTIWGNSADANGGGVGCYNGASAKVTNSILWANTAASGKEILLDQAPAQISITYSNVSGGQSGVRNNGGSLSWGAGNIDADPYFADPDNGNYHPKSQAGRWDPNSQSWIQDDVTSPCIDAGDPDSDWTAELWPNGIRINMGIYGGTLQASRSLSDVGNIADLNRDRIIDSADMCIMIERWGTDDQYCDIAPVPFGDGNIDIQDLVVLGENLFVDYRMIAHWKLDEAEGDIAYDSVANCDGTLSGGPVWQPGDGMVDGALQFDGVNDFVSTEFVLNPTDRIFSVFAWMKGGAPGQVIISQSDGNGTGEAWLCTDMSNGKLMTGLVPQKIGRYYPQPLISGSIITDGQWHHVGVVWDGSYRALYVDGIKVAKDDVAQNPLKIADGGLHIGAGKTLALETFFSGLIDDVRIYDVVLSTKEIAALVQ